MDNHWKVALSDDSYAALNLQVEQLEQEISFCVRELAEHPDEYKEDTKIIISRQRSQE
jgi:hypothetical protein